jgi:N6-L-threonylcarbamoyladenine synthase
MLVVATAEALDATGVERLVVSGGVSANRRLRERMTELGEARGVEVVVPRPVLCTDNAAMIALAGWPRLAGGENDGLGIEADAALPFGAAWSG